MQEIHPFPFLAIVGQPELKTALVLGLINPHIGGILLSGPYGVGKTTAVRGLLDIMPSIEYEDENEEGDPVTYVAPMRMVELPLNARIEDVVGGLNERVALEQHRVVLEEGILSKANRQLLYVDEINLLDPQVIDAILDAAAQGQTMVRRGAMTRLLATRFVLIGSMNPEEGTLRPQIMDRFGLRVWVSPLLEAEDRLEIYRRNRDFRNDQASFRAQYIQPTAALQQEVAVAREILPHVTIPPDIETMTLAIIHELKIPSHRAEISLLESARARAAADFRSKVIVEDIVRLAPMALRHRHSSHIEGFTAEIDRENQVIQTVVQQILARFEGDTGDDGSSSLINIQDTAEQTERGFPHAPNQKERRTMVREIEQDE